MCHSVTEQFKYRAKQNRRNELMYGNTFTWTVLAGIYQIYTEFEEKKKIQKKSQLFIEHY